MIINNTVNSVAKIETNLTLEIDNVYTHITGPMSSNHWTDIERLLSFRPEGYQFTPLFNKWIVKNGVRIKRVWDGWQRQIWKNKKKTYFPTGLFSIIKEYFLTNNIPYRVIDRRIKPANDANISFVNGFELYPFQKKVVDDASLVTRGIIQSATGSGKTSIAAGIIERLKVLPVLFFVTSNDLLVQAIESFAETLKLYGLPLTPGQIGGGKVDIREINVITVQTAIRALGEKWTAKYKFDDEDEETDKETPIEENREKIRELFNNTKLALSDEIQHWKSESCQLVSKNLPNTYYTYGLSATPERDSGDDMLIQACFGKKICQVSASYLIKNINPNTGQPYLMKPRIKMVHIRSEPSAFKNYQSIYTEQVVENEAYNNLIVKIANHYINRGRSVLVLAKIIKHCELLASKINGSLLLHGSSKKRQRKDGIARLRRKEISCIVGSTILDEGVDIRSLDTLIICSQGKSKTRAMQRIGRTLRTFENKPEPIIVDFCIHQKYLLDHAKQRIKMYKSEPEFIIETATVQDILSSTTPI